MAAGGFQNSQVICEVEVAHHAHTFLFLIYGFMFEFFPDTMVTVFLFVQHFVSNSTGVAVNAWVQERSNGLSWS